MNRLLGALCVGIAAIAITVMVDGQRHAAIASDTMMAHPATAGFNLHIDADHHFGETHPAEIAHHWCKTISPSLTECQLYDGDGPHARLVGVETIVPAAVWKTFSPAERGLWHYHKIELMKIHATLPDTPKDQQAAVIAAIAPTYGKVFILWDPMSNANPTGQPSVTVLH